jgi:hypothetical protein
LPPVGSNLHSFLPSCSDKRDLARELRAKHTKRPGQATLGEVSAPHPFPWLSETIDLS